MSRAALLINLGSPSDTSVKSVKTYLGEFLMDDHVIDLPFWKRWLLVKGIILNFRPKKSAKAYKSIWWKDGSPLIVISKRLQEKVQAKTNTPVYLAMRYAQPSIQSVLDKMHQERPDLKEIYVVPLYPHFAMSSYETVYDKVLELMKVHYPSTQVKIKKAWYNDDDYIKILANSIQEKLPEDHHLLFSYHGIPIRHVQKSDVTGCHCLKVENCCKTPSPAHEYCYRHQTLESTRLVVEKLGLEPGTYETSFQSRLGRDPWLEPFTAQRFEELPKEGKKKLAVVCPAFVSDCLETLEEINEEGKEEYMHAGGESFVSIPCLNDRADWSALLAQWIDEDKA